MELSQAVGLIDTPHLVRAIPQTWADLGAGTGTFTRALASILGESSIIYAVDAKAADLKQIKVRASISLQTMQADFVRDALNLSGLTGILMANSLHYVKDQLLFIDKLKASFANSGRFLLVEYDTDDANPWVPYPLSFSSLSKLFKQAGYTTIEKIGETPSIYNRSNIYSAWIES